jgi:dihydropteroate synthase
LTQHASTQAPHREADRPERLSRIDRLWPRSQPLVMGILNCTPDSFSDGGRCFDFDDALRHAETLLDGGADIIDVGGESTRPGADPVDATEEMRRVVPIITEIRLRRPHVVVSVDTSKVEVAEASLNAGADLVNDVTAASADDMLELVARSNAGIVFMHMRGEPRTMQSDTTYDNVVAEVHELLRSRARAAIAAGIPAHRVWLDPGIGFGKDDDGNLALLAAMPDLSAAGHPVLIGPSNKSFIGRLTGAGVDDRLPGTLAALLPAVGIDRAVVRVHDASAAVQFLAIASRLHEASA